MVIPFFQSILCRCRTNGIAAAVFWDPRRRALYPGLRSPLLPALVSEWPDPFFNSRPPVRLGGQSRTPPLL